MEKPFVSFCITSHNQCEYALLALKAAIAQDYQNMEIIVADDASTDGSAEALQRYAIESGRNNVRILTSETNLDRMKNFERLFLAARGELIIEADGDDISEPNRVSRIVEEWEKGGKRATVIIHDGIKIDPKGRVVGHVGCRSIECPLGACMAFSPRVVKEFPSAAIPNCIQDHVFTPRALWIGEPLVMPDRLVRYRVGSGISSVMYNRRATELRMARIRESGYRQSLLDLEHCIRSGMMTEEKSLPIRKLCEDGIVRSAATVQLIEGAGIVEKWLAYKTLYGKGVFDPASWLRLPYLLPWRLCMPFYFCYDAIKLLMCRISASLGLVK